MQNDDFSLKWDGKKWVTSWRVQGLYFGIKNRAKLAPKPRDTYKGPGGICTFTTPKKAI